MTTPAPGSPHALRSPWAWDGRSRPEGSRALHVAAAAAPSSSRYSLAGSPFIRGLHQPVDMRGHALAFDTVDMDGNRRFRATIAEPVNLVKPGMAEAGISR